MLALLVVLTSCGSSSASSSPPASGTASSAAQSTSTQSSTAGSGGSHRACGPAQSTTLAAGSVARVYSVGQVVYGCAARGGRAFRLGASMRTLREGRAGPIALAGTVAAYGLTQFGVDTVRTEVVVRRLTDGATLANLPASRAVGVESFQSVGSIVVKADGAVAWIGSDRSIIAHRAQIEVHAAHGSSDSLLDAGPDIAPASLRLDGSTLTWQVGGATRHATLH
jgi:hypothetical protein